MIEFEFKSMRDPDPEVNPGRSITFVNIYHFNRITKNSEFLYSGYTIKSANEPFNKALGQKYAVKDAMRNVARVNREIIWRYFGVYSKAVEKLMGGYYK